MLRCVSEDCRGHGPIQLGPVQLLVPSASEITVPPAIVTHTKITCYPTPEHCPTN